MIKTLVENTMNMYTSHSPYPEEWDLKSMLDYCEQLFLPEHSLTPEQLLNMSKEEVHETLLESALNYYERREEELGPDIMRQLERFVMLKVVDQKWMDHLDAMDQLRQGIGLRAYGQQDPLVQYKFEGYQMFNDMVAAIQEDTVRLVLRANIVQEQREGPKNVVENKYSEEDARKEPVRSKKVGRNDLCPCGSGKKYKKCCGKGA